MVKQISQAQFEHYKNNGWIVRDESSAYQGRVYTLCKKDGSIACCARTLQYSLAAPVVFALTLILAPPACAVSVESFSPCGNVNLIEESVSEDSENCLEIVCGWNRAICTALQPCYSSYSMSVLVANPGEDDSLLS